MQRGKEGATVAGEEGKVRLFTPGERRAAPMDGSGLCAARGGGLFAELRSVPALSFDDDNDTAPAHFLTFHLPGFLRFALYVICPNFRMFQSVYPNQLDLSKSNQLDPVRVGTLRFLCGNGNKV